MDFKDQFDVKEAIFRGVIVEIGHLKPISAYTTHPWYIFTNDQNVIIYRRNMSST